MKAIISCKTFIKFFFFFFTLLRETMKVTYLYFLLGLERNSKARLKIFFAKRMLINCVFL